MSEWLLRLFGAFPIEIVGSFLFFHIIFLISQHAQDSFRVNEYVDKKTLDKLVKKSKDGEVDMERVLKECAFLHVDMSVRVAATIHAAIVIVGGIVNLIVISPPPIIFEDFSAPFPAARFYFCLALGYFLWDLFISVKYHYDYSFWLHAIGCCLTYVIVLIPFAPIVGFGCLMFELSTPLVHFRWLLITLGKTDAWWFSPLSWSFLGVFVVSRIIVGNWFAAWWMPKMWSILWSEGISISTVTRITCVFSLTIYVALAILNLYWVLLPLTKATKRAQGKQHSSSIMKEALDVDDVSAPRNISVANNAHKLN
eukprot:TRINITY_DN1414_c0_g1_i1.p1 TRINITY_DN1414_c0_g1~~TRINITY_DN1414_c0_g1_i1.p1  ORF type:complete len:311 (-),score=29.77 TRINITY_DN1414_c0_g1_i1:443-1375(-)